MRGGTFKTDTAETEITMAANGNENGNENENGGRQCLRQSERERVELLDSQIEEQTNLQDMLQQCLDDLELEDTIYQAVLLFDDDDNHDNEDSHCDNNAPASIPTFHKKGLLSKVKSLKVGMAQQEMELDFYQQKLGDARDELEYYMERQPPPPAQAPQIIPPEEQKETELKHKVQALHDTQHGITQLRAKLSAHMNTNIHSVSNTASNKKQHVARLGPGALGAVKLVTKLATELRDLQRAVQNTKLDAAEAVRKLEEYQQRNASASASDDDYVNGNGVSQAQEQQYHEQQLQQHQQPHHENDFGASDRDCEPQEEYYHPNGNRLPHGIRSQHNVSHNNNNHNDNESTGSGTGTGPLPPPMTLDAKLLSLPPEAAAEAVAEATVPQPRSPNKHTIDEATTLFVELAGSSSPHQTISLVELLEHWVELQDMLDVEDLYQEELVAIFDSIPKVENDKANVNDMIDLDGFIALYQGIEDLFEDEYEYVYEDNDNDCDEEGTGNWHDEVEHDANVNVNGENNTHNHKKTPLATTKSSSNSSHPLTIDVWELLRRMVGLSKRAMIETSHKLSYRTQSSTDAMIV
jgi:hypothetical protein